MAATAPAAFAHPGLVRSDPSDSAVVGPPPRAVRLWFSEPISDRFSSARVLDINGAEVPLVHVSTDLAAQRQLIVELPDGLAAGVYSVDWKVLSDADGHVTAGHIVFGLGASDQSTTALSANRHELPIVPGEAILRWLNLLSLATVVGGLGIGELVFARAARRHGLEQGVAGLLDQARRRALVWTAWCGGAAVVVGIGLFVWQAAALGANAQASGSALDADWQLLSQTRWGALSITREALVVVLTAGALLVARRATRSARQGLSSRLVVAALGTLCVALMSVQALSGHAASPGPSAALAVGVDGLHLLAASVWIGGLAALSAGLWPWLSPNRVGFAAALVGLREFGRLAALSICVLVPTGLYAMGRQVASLDGLLTTFYGQTLLTKLVLGTAVGVIGLLNLALVHPWRGLSIRGRWWRAPRLPRAPMPVLLAVESALGLMVLLATGVVTSAVPPNGPEFAPPAKALTTTASQSVDDLLVNLEVKPNLAGPNMIMVRATSTRRPRPAPVTGAALRFTYLGDNPTASDGAPGSATMERLDPDTYRLGGDYLSRPGPWRIDVEVHRLGSANVVAPFTWNVAVPEPEARPVVFSNQPLARFLNPATVAVSLMLGLLAAGALWRRRSPRPQRRRRGLRGETLVVEFARRR